MTSNVQGIKLSLIIIANLFATIVSAQVKDSLYLSNGQLLIGELKSISLGKINFDADNLQVLNIKSDRVKTIQARSHLYRVQTIHRTIYYGNLLVGESGKVGLINKDTLIQLGIDEIAVLLPLRGKTGSFWEGNASVGYSYTRSSGIGRFNSDYSVSYTTKKYLAISQGSIIFTQTDSTLEADNASALFLGSYIFNPVWDGSLFFNYQRNLELGLARRYQEGLGMGLTFLSKVHVRARAIAGVVFNQEKSTEDVYTPTQMEIPLIIAFSFFKFNKPDMTLGIRQSFYAGITQAGRFRQEGQLTVNWKIIGDLSINLQLYDNYDNQPPGLNAESFDYGVVFGLNYKFSQ